MEMETTAKRQRLDQDVLDMMRYGAIIQNVKGLGDHEPDTSSLTEIAKFKEWFGCSPRVACYLWEMLEDCKQLYDKDHPTAHITRAHLLWALFYMKQYPTEGVCCAAVGGRSGAIDPKTLRKYVWFIIDAIADLEEVVVSCTLCLICNFCRKLTAYVFFCLLYTQIEFDTRWQGVPKFSRTALTVDGTDQPIPEHGREYFSHKFKGSALRYEVAVGIHTGLIHFLNGPFPAGKFPDINIFRLGLKTELEENETCEADDGYLGEHPKYIRCPKGLFNDPEREAMQARVRSRHETVNRRFKQWKIMSTKFRHDLHKHGYAFRAVAVITQLSLKLEGGLFKVNYA